MRNTAQQLKTVRMAIAVADLDSHVQNWTLNCRIEGHSPRTLDTRRDVLRKFIWFMKKRGYTVCGTVEIRAFMEYLLSGHEEVGGRWGNPRQVKPLRPITIRDTYYNHIRAFFSWLTEEEGLDASPMARIKPPVARADQIRPFSNEHLEAIIGATRKTRHVRRDEAAVRFLLDSGARASELCGLKMKDLDLQGGRCTVLGKGGKHRQLFLGRKTLKALWDYLREDERNPGQCQPHEPVFLSDRGKDAGEALTTSGLRQMIERLGRIAKVQAVRCSPHTFRHTYAIMFLRNGGQTFALQQMLGHTSLAMTQKYVALAQADIENQHRQFSPGDRLNNVSR